MKYIVHNISFLYSLEGDRHVKCRAFIEDISGRKRDIRCVFSVKQGEVFGFLGPNGAGKSTTIRHIMGFMKPDKGTVTINGLDTWRDQGKVQALVGYLPGEIAFLTG